VPRPEEEQDALKAVCLQCGMRNEEPGGWRWCDFDRGVASCDTGRRNAYVRRVQYEGNECGPWKAATAKDKVPCT
jgi:hypothetical protein